MTVPLVKSAQTPPPEVMSSATSGARLSTTAATLSLVHTGARVPWTRDSILIFQEPSIGSEVFHRARILPCTNICAFPGPAERSSRYVYHSAGAVWLTTGNVDHMPSKSCER